MASQDAAAIDLREVNPPSAAKATGDVKVPAETTPASAKAPEADTKTSDHPDPGKKSSKAKCTKKHKAKAKNKKPLPVESSDDDSTSEDADDLSEDSDSSDSDSESEAIKKKRSSRKHHQESQKAKKKSRGKKTKKAAKTRSSPGSDTDLYSSDETVEDSDDEEIDRRSSDRGSSDLQAFQFQLQMLEQQNAAKLRAINNFGAGGSGIPDYLPPSYDARLGLGGTNRGLARRGATPVGRKLRLAGLDGDLRRDGRRAKQKQKQKKRTGDTKLEYKRVDQVWDNAIHNYKLQDTAESTNDSQYEDVLFHVRRTFDWEGKYKTTIVDIKSKPLRECLQDVMGNIKGVSLVEETPKLDPNLLFLYLEDLRKHLKQLKKAKPSASDKRERKKEAKKIENKRKHLRILVKYIDKDYDQVKNSLYPMLENGLITFDLLWALWKPNTLAYTTTYGSHDEPRVFKVEMAEKHGSILKGDFYYIEGKYFEYDGKQFGYGSMFEEIGDFRGARKITSLACYPLKYHKNEEKIRNDLVERGKKFVALSGVHYKSHQGMAYYKKKKSVIKVNINGRVMIDPSIHRRINPNYPISLVRPKDHDILSEDDDSDMDSCGLCGGSDSEGGGGHECNFDDDDAPPKYVTKVFKDEQGKIHKLSIPKSEVEGEGSKKALDKVASKDEQKAESGEATPAESDGKSAKSTPEFTNEEYLIASPVILGFAFAEKLWLEFTVSGVKDIQWNENAYESLVLEPKTKDIVKALVESHKFHPAESIDDVIQGKGKGLVAVLHGPPGTGKTLTAEGISELLKCPLYMVSAGELGTDSRFLEGELQKILDICHSWGAILLLDEADVFLEKRNMHDIHRNALVSIFLRQLEYFQGILFLTTNRVETFDDAFQSRIHIALRYDNLDTRAKKAIFKIFVERVRVLEKIDLMPFSEEDFNTLAKHDLNGRQIKNTVGTAQALAVNKGEPLSMKHIRQVLDVQMSFDRDLKGGTGYQDAMRSYF